MTEDESRRRHERKLGAYREMADLQIQSLITLMTIAVSKKTSEAEDGDSGGETVTEIDIDNLSDFSGQDRTDQEFQRIVSQQIENLLLPPTLA